MGGWARVSGVDGGVEASGAQAKEQHHRGGGGGGGADKETRRRLRNRRRRRWESGGTESESCARSAGSLRVVIIINLSGV